MPVRVSSMVCTMWSKLMQFHICRALLQEYGVRIRFIGRREMFPEDVRAAVEEMEEMTAKHTRWVWTPTRKDPASTYDPIIGVCSTSARRMQVGMKSRMLSKRQYRMSQTAPLTLGRSMSLDTRLRVALRQKVTAILHPAPSFPSWRHVRA